MTAPWLLHQRTTMLRIRLAEEPVTQPEIAAMNSATGRAVGQVPDLSSVQSRAATTGSGHS
jgi:hypothetical protein